MPALLAGPTTKKRKLEEISGGTASASKPEQLTQLKDEASKLKKVIASLQSENALLKAQAAKKAPPRAVRPSQVLCSAQ